MQWFARLGRETSLCEAELATRETGELVFERGFGFGSGPMPDWDRLGGITRAGQLVKTRLSSGKPALVPALVDAIGAIDPTASKLNIGLSAPGMDGKDLFRLGQSLKKTYATQYDRKLRLVYPKAGNELNTGQILNNQLLKSPNAELTIIKTPDGLQAIGRTLWHQDIESYTRRDRERPARDARVGMLPPKLAQIMLNLARVKIGEHVHDPFCGTGVVLTEALLMKATVSGSDLSPAMVTATQRNIDWLQKTYHLPRQDTNITQQDARKLKLPTGVTHIVAEGYLGNPDLSQNDVSRMQKEALSLKPLYLDFFRALKQYASPLTILLALPEWHPAKSPMIQLDILDDISDMGYTTEQFAPHFVTRLSYHRSHQAVGRAIIKVQKG